LTPRGTNRARLARAAIAQGLDGRAFPWGDDDDAKRKPAFTTGRVMPPPDDVDAHPDGARPLRRDGRLL
jgi:hypothetical protein